MNKLTFTINVSQFLTIQVMTPSLYNIDVTHMDGIVYELHIPPSVMRWVGDKIALLEHVEAAAKNNFESYRKTA